MIADTLHEGESLFEIGFIQIIEKQTTHAPGFVTVLEKEIVVAPPLVTRIDIRTKRLTRLARLRMPMDHVLMERIKRRQIEATTKPPDRRLALFFGDEETHIGVRRRYIRVIGMNHQRHPHRLELAIGQFGTLGSR